MRAWFSTWHYSFCDHLHFFSIESCSRPHPPLSVPTLTLLATFRSLGPSAHRTFVGNASQPIRRASDRESHVRTRPVQFHVELGEGSFVLHVTAASGESCLPFFLSNQHFCSLEHACLSRLSIILCRSSAQAPAASAPASCFTSPTPAEKPLLKRNRLLKTPQQ